VFLSNARVIGSLQPYVLASWEQNPRGDPPEEVRAVLAKAGRWSTNVKCFVLDSAGEVRHSFDGFGGQRGPTGDLQSLVPTWVSEIAESSKKIGAPERKNPLALPEVKDGVRMFVRLTENKVLTDRLWYTPVVHVFPDEGERRLFLGPERPREIDASKLSRWLGFCYPPGVNEQLTPFEIVEGRLTLSQAGILSGRVRLSRRDPAKIHSFEGDVEAILTPKGDAFTLRGVIEGTYTRPGRGADGRSTSKIAAVIESRPE
jgi:hypothetical protein